MADKCTIEGVNRGEVTLGQILKLNALLDAQAAAEEKAMKATKT